MQKAKRTLGNPVKRVATALAVLGLAGALVLPSTAGADASAIAPGMALVFSGGKAHSVADNIAVPVDCLGEGQGFCSGVITLSRSGHRISVPFSVRGGGHEVLFVPLRLGGGKAHPRKVHGVATTVQPQGPATSTREFLYAE
jgi:hypothetical protein